jgi:hypothetical protein
MEKDFPRFLIGYNKEYMQIFLELLKIGTEECKREVLALLEILPINIDYKIYIRDVVVSKIPATSEKQQTEWQKFFMWNKQEHQNYSSCTYFLMILEDLVIPKKEGTN